MKWPLCCVCLFLVPSVCAQTPHPRIWLDSTTVTRLTVLKNANDISWVTLKAHADAYAAETVAPYRTCPGGQICYDYEGGGWWDAVSDLALAYQMTGSTTYSDKVRQILDAFVKAGSAPCTVDSYYPSRFAVLALGIGYDWVYPTLTSTQKTNYTALLDSCWTLVQANGYKWDRTANPSNGYSNYFGGHLLGYGVAALAVEGDDLNSAVMQSAINAEFNNFVANIFTTVNGNPGGFAGGYAVEGYNYGGSHFIRLFQYMKAMTTAGKTDLFNNDIAWLKLVAKNTIYERRPDNFSIFSEGGWNGSWVGIFYYNLPWDLSGMLNGTTEGGWMKQLYSTFTRTPPADSVPPSLYTPSDFELFFYNQGQSAIDYTATQPTYYFSSGDNHTFVRTDWTTSAVYSVFHGGTIGPGDWPEYADHAPRAAGNLFIQRGADQLLINAGQWAGNDGVEGSGSPSSIDIANVHLNTMSYWDQGTNCLNQTTYNGCQGYWAQPNTVKHNEGTGFAFQEAPLENAYYNSTHAKTLSSYTRSWVNINDISFVFDRITAPLTSVRLLEWHTPALTSASPAGIARALSLSGGLATATVGSSKLWIDTLIPSSPTINEVTDTVGNGDGKLMTTQRFEVADPNASSCSTNCLFLTVLAPTASSVSAMPTTTLITTNKYKGGFYNDGTLPRIALFSADGTAQTSVTYTALYSSALTGRHVIADLAPGTYNVTKDGTTLYSGLTVGTDGSLSFTTTGGTTYAITQIGGPPAATPLQPPTGLGGTAR
jgi:hypothetical protein